MSLKQKTKIGLAWSGVNRVAAHALAFIVQVVLARLLPPNEFGLVAAVTIFIFVGQIIVDGGFGDALVQASSVSRLDLSSIFFFNLGVSAILILMLLVFGPGIAHFYKEPRLTHVVWGLSLNLLLYASCVTPGRMMMRELQFKRIFWISVVAQAAGAVVGVAMAVAGANVWALVWQSLTIGLVTAILTWIGSDPAWWPRWEFSLDSVRRMIPFGAGVMASQIVASVQQNVYAMIVGRAYSMTDLAYYNRANQFQRIPSYTISHPLTTVLFPAFANVQQTPEKIVDALRKGIPILCFCVFGLMSWLIVTAEPLINILLTARWAPAAEYLKIFPLVGMVYPLWTINATVLRAMGKSSWFFLVVSGQALMSLLALAITVWWGITAIVVGQVVVAWLDYLTSAVLANLVLASGLRTQLRCVVVHLVPSLAAVLVAGPIRPLLGSNNYWIFVGSTAVFVLTYSMLCWMLRVEGFLRTWALLADTIMRRTNQKATLQSTT